MPSFAFARPLWSVTRYALADLTRLALTALILAAGLGGAAAAGPADLPAQPIATVVASRPVIDPVAARAVTAPVPAVRPAAAPVTAVRPLAASVTAFEHLPVRALAAAGPPHAEPTDAALSAVATRPAALRLPTDAGEPTRRGPPAA